MTDKEILEAIKSGKKISETFLNYLVNSSYVVGEKNYHSRRVVYRPSNDY